MAQQFGAIGRCKELGSVHHDITSERDLCVAHTRTGDVEEDTLQPMAASTDLNETGPGGCHHHFSVARSVLEPQSIQHRELVLNHFLDARFSHVHDADSEIDVELPVEHPLVILPDGGHLVLPFVRHRVHNILFSFEELLADYLAVHLPKHVESPMDLVEASAQLLQGGALEHAVAARGGNRLHDDRVRIVLKLLQKGLHVPPVRAPRLFDRPNATSPHLFSHKILVPAHLSHGSTVPLESQGLAHHLRTLHGRLATGDACQQLVGQLIQNLHSSRDVSVVLHRHRKLHLEALWHQVH
mmetsp:Transcript_16853/g.18792  ORF Transcript_16853/g.18792 Transcript_16853/m.18792 type:complete len:298 (-) Transcript_16853:1894-2787(-)